MTSKPSHLSESSIAGKKYEYKKECLFCYAMYDRDISDALEPNVYCSLPCELNDQYLTENPKYSE